MSKANSMRDEHEREELSFDTPFAQQFARLNEEGCIWEGRQQETERDRERRDRRGQVNALQKRATTT